MPEQPSLLATGLYYLWVVVVIGGIGYAFVRWVRWDWREEAEYFSQEINRLAMYVQSDALGPEKLQANEASWLMGHGRVRQVATQNWLVWYAWKTSEGRTLIVVNYHYMEPSPNGFPIVQNDHSENLSILDCGAKSKDEWTAWKRGSKSFMDQIVAELTSSYQPLERWQVNYYGP